MKNLLIIFCLVIAGLSTSAQKTEWNNWNDGFNKAVDTDKPLVVFVYASWCHVCSKMEENTFANTDVANKLKADYIAVKFDIDSEEKYNFKGKEYNSQELFKKLAKGKVQLGIPTVLFYSPAKEELYTEMGYKKTEEFLDLLSKYKKKI